MKNRTTFRIYLLVAAIAMVVGLVPAGAASAHSGAAVLAGEATLPTFPCPAPSTCGGSFSGTAVLGVAGTDADVAGSASASFAYTDDCVNGTANGTITASGGVLGSVSDTVHFAWTRVGLTAVLITDGSSHSVAGVAAFVPGVGATACAPGGSGSLTATVAGAGAWL